MAAEAHARDIAVRIRTVRNLNELRSIEMLSRILDFHNPSNPRVPSGTRVVAVCAFPALQKAECSGVTLCSSSSDLEIFLPKAIRG